MSPRHQRNADGGAAARLRKLHIRWVRLFGDGLKKNGIDIEARTALTTLSVSALRP